MAEDERGSFEISGEGRTPVGPGPESSFDSTRLDFGHYAGRTLAELAESDPDYLHWLARHPSGVRYRSEIARVLSGAIPHASDWHR